MSYTKISNNDRRKTARRLRDAANCRNVQISPSALGRLIKAEDRSYRESCVRSPTSSSQQRLTPARPTGAIRSVSCTTTGPSCSR